MEKYLCDYGCGQEATHQFKNGKWCCSKSFHSCSAEISRSKIIQTGKKRTAKTKDKLKVAWIKRREYLKKKKKIKEEKIKYLISINNCSYGCEQPAKSYSRLTKKYCCDKYFYNCPSQKTIQSRKVGEIITQEHILCSYGCGNQAKYYFNGNKTYSCKKRSQSCPAVRKKNSDKNKLIERTENLWLLGKTWEEIHGGEKSKKLRELHSQRMLNGEAKRMNNFITKEIIEKQRQYMLNGGAIIALKGVKNPSKPEVLLREIIKELYSTCEFQYPILNFSVDVAILEYKIVIEYDGSYWHQDKEKDLERQKKIEDLGWKFIRYIDDVPSKEKINQDIKSLM